ncbi:MAG: hypothetical protein ACREDN_03665 [Aestuariivirga sp.]
MQQALLARARQFPGQEKHVYEHYRKNPGALIELRGPIFEQKVVDLIVAKAKVSEKAVSREELQAMVQDEGEYEHHGHDQHEHDDDHDHHGHEHHHHAHEPHGHEHHGHEHHGHDHDHAHAPAKGKPKPAGAKPRRTAPSSQG